MARHELALSVLISRSALGLVDLEINDHVNYYVAKQFLGGQVTWNRQQAQSPFYDGQVTVQRSRGNVTEQLTVETLGADAPTLYTNLQAIIQAMVQDSFTMTITMDSQVTQYQCEAADYQVAFEGNRFIARQVQVNFSLPRRPVPLLGSF